MKTNSTSLLLLALVMGGCHQASTPPPPAALPPVEVGTVQARWETRPTFEEVVGSVQSRQRAEMEAKVSARIERLPVVPGQRVAQGDLLAQLELPPQACLMVGNDSCHDLAAGQVGMPTCLLTTWRIDREPVFVADWEGGHPELLEYLRLY